MNFKLQKFFTNNYREFVHRQALIDILKLVPEVELKDVDTIDNILSITFSVDDNGENPIYVRYLDLDGQEHIVKLKPNITDQLTDTLSKYATIEYSDAQDAKLKDDLVQVIADGDKNTITICNNYTDEKLAPINDKLSNIPDGQKVTPIMYDRDPAVSVGYITIDETGYGGQPTSHSSLSFYLDSNTGGGEYEFTLPLSSVPDQYLTGGIELKTISYDVDNRSIVFRDMDDTTYRLNLGDEVSQSDIDDLKEMINKINAKLVNIADGETVTKINWTDENYQPKEIGLYTQGKYLKETVDYQDGTSKVAYNPMFKSTKIHWTEDDIDEHVGEFILTDHDDDKITLTVGGNGSTINWQTPVYWLKKLPATVKLNLEGIDNDVSNVTVNAHDKSFVVTTADGGQDTYYFSKLTDDEYQSLLAKVTSNTNKLVNFKDGQTVTNEYWYTEDYRPNYVRLLVDGDYIRYHIDRSDGIEKIGYQPMFKASHEWLEAILSENDDIQSISTLTAINTYFSEPNNTVTVADGGSSRTFKFSARDNAWYDMVDETIKNGNVSYSEVDYDSYVFELPNWDGSLTLSLKITGKDAQYKTGEHTYHHVTGTYQLGGDVLTSQFKDTFNCIIPNANGTATLSGNNFSKTIPFTDKLAFQFDASEVLPSYALLSVDFWYYE